MKKSSIIFLQTVIVFIGLGSLVLLLWEPHLEGVNANATTLAEIYFNDPFLALVYLGSVPFFVALYQAFKLLSRIASNQIFTSHSVKALGIIKYCALIIITFVVAEEIFIMLTHGDDDAAGAVFVGLLISFASIVIAATAIVFERVLQKAVELKSKNDLTV